MLLAGLSLALVGIHFFAPSSAKLLAGASFLPSLPFLDAFGQHVQTAGQLKAVPQSPFLLSVIIPWPPPPSTLACCY